MFVVSCKNKTNRWECSTKKKEKTMSHRVDFNHVLNVGICVWYCFWRIGVPVVVNVVLAAAAETYVFYN